MLVELEIMYLLCWAPEQPYLGFASWQNLSIWANDGLVCSNAL